MKLTTRWWKPQNRKKKMYYIIIRAVTFETLSKHLGYSVLRLINCMNEFEALEKNEILWN